MNMKKWADNKQIRKKYPVYKMLKNKTRSKPINPVSISLRVYQFPLAFYTLGIFHAFVVVCWHFHNQLFQKESFRNTSECQTVWIQIRTDVTSVLIWAQTVCKGYQQTIKVAAGQESVNW